MVVVTEARERSEKAEEPVLEGQAAVVIQMGLTVQMEMVEVL